MMPLRVLICVVFLLVGSSVAIALEPDQVFAKASKSIVVVGAAEDGNDNLSQGSGVIIAPGEIVTNCHVVENATIIAVARESYKSIANLRFFDPDRDLCQLSVVDSEGFESAVPRIVEVSDLRIGEKVYAIGAPQSLELTISDGLISSIRHTGSGDVIQTTAPISPGSSGGGLFNAEGDLIGITTFIFQRGQNLNFAIPASWITELSGRSIDRFERELSERKSAQHAIMITDWNAENDRIHQEERKRQEAMQLEEQFRAEDLEEHLAALTPQQRLVADFRAHISANVRSRIVVPPDISGNPEAVYEVVLLPGGDVLSATLRKSSGVRTYDEAVLSAIMAAQPLPVPSDPNLFHDHFRQFNMRFQPKK